VTGRRRLLAFAAAALAAAAGPAAGARAAGDLAIGIEDERILLDEPHRAPAAVAEWAALGIDVVRVHARWNRLAPAADATHRPSGFRPADPEDPRYDWTELDRAVALLRGAGLDVALTVTGPGPLWTSGRPALKNPRYKPKASEFGAFARAVARRYTGQIKRYLIYNEPNIPGWLDPQLDCVTRRGHRYPDCTPVAPHLYRALANAAIPAIRAEDPAAEVLIGELAPIGRPPRSDRSTMAPLPFFRALGCVDARFKAIRTGACRGFKAVSADGIGHHPHPVDLAPGAPSGEPGWAKMGDLPRFERTLDRLTSRGRIRTTGGGRLPLHLTEFGYQTSPPDHAIGIPVSRHAAWVQQATYLAWKDPRVHSLVHYQWEDEPVRYRGTGSLSYSGWQSGLHYVNGRPKPALESVMAPLVVERRAAGSSRVWGQVLGDRVTEVTLERDGGAGFRPLARIQTNAFGFWSRTLRLDPGDDLRFRWSDPARTAPRISRVVTVPSSPRTKLSAAR
jgi:hypothetical protein